MRKISFILLFILLCYCASASVSVTTSEQYYNLGDDVRSYLKISSEGEANGILKSSLSCSSYALLFYVKPIEIQGYNESTNIAVPAIPANAQMVGNCTIQSSIESYNGVVLMNSQSEQFYVTTELTILANQSSTNVLPGDELLVNIKVIGASGQKISANINLNFNNNEFIRNNTESAEIILPILKNIASGQHDIMIKADDRYGNHGESSISIFVTPLPTRLENQLNSDTFKPQETLKAIHIIYDQADDSFNGTVTIKIISPGKNEILSDKFQAGSEITYEFKNQDAPGEYYIISSINEIVKEDIIRVVEVKEITSAINGAIATFKNIGNVVYDNKESIVIEGNQKRYQITKKLNLNPGDSYDIDLSKEVPTGNYDITLPQSSGAINQQASLKGIPIQDDRSFLKKMGMGMKSITGAYTGTGVVSSRPYIASILLIIIILGVVFFYSRNAIRKMFGKE